MREVFARPQRRRVRRGIGAAISRSIALEAVALRPDFVVSPAFSRHVLEVSAADSQAMRVRLRLLRQLAEDTERARAGAT